MRAHEFDVKYRWRVWRGGALLGAALALAAACLAGGEAEARTVRIGYQKYGQLIVLKAKGWLEPALEARGDVVEWKLFTAGPQLLEALDAGAIDVGITGDAPPVAAQANGGGFVYAGVEPPGPQGEAIVVPPGSTLHSVAELRGKRVALNRASNVHWLLLRALEAAHLPWSAIHPVYLAPPDGRAAFGSGAVEAWAIWDPFLSEAEADAGARILRDGKGLVGDRQFIVAASGFAKNAPDTLHAVLAALARSDAWAATHRAEVGPILADAVGLPVAAIRQAAERLSFGLAPIDAKVLTEQQAIADAFFAAGLIPTKVRVADAAWHPGP